MQLRYQAAPDTADVRLVWGNPPYRAIRKYAKMPRDFGPKPMILAAAGSRYGRQRGKTWQSTNRASLFGSTGR